MGRAASGPRIPRAPSGVIEPTAEVAAACKPSPTRSGERLACAGPALTARQTCHEVFLMLPNGSYCCLYMPAVLRHALRSVSHSSSIRHSMLTMITTKPITTRGNVFVFFVLLLSGVCASGVCASGVNAQAILSGILVVSPRMPPQPARDVQTSMLAAKG